MEQEQLFVEKITVAAGSASGSAVLRHPAGGVSIHVTRVGVEASAPTVATFTWLVERQMSVVRDCKTGLFVLPSENGFAFATVVAGPGSATPHARVQIGAHKENGAARVAVTLAQAAKKAVQVTVVGCYVMAAGPWSAWIHLLKNDAGTKLVSASRWYARGLRWEKHIAKHIVEHKCDANLGLPPTYSLTLAQELFVALPSMDRERDFPDKAARDRFLIDVLHGQCASAVFGAEEDKLTAAYEACVRCGDAGHKYADAKKKLKNYQQACGSAITQTHELVSRLSGVVEHLATKKARAHDDTRIRTPEELVDLSAMKLAEVCGFSDSAGEPDGTHPFEITTKGTYFQLGGWEVEAVPDIFIVRTTRGTDDLVIVFEDKSGQMSEGGMAQLLGEMLLCHYHNHYFASSLQEPPRRVFAVRLYDVWASLYSLEASAEQVRSLCEAQDGVDNRFTKMKFTSSIEEPWSAAKGKCGANLLNQPERREFIQLMAKLRHHLVSRL